MLSKVFAVCLLLAVAHAASISVTTPGGPYPVGTWSRWIFIEASASSNASVVTVSWQEDSTNQLEFSSTSCTLTGQGNPSRSCSYRVKGATTGVYAVTFTVNGDNGQFPGGVATQSYIFTQRPIYFDDFDSTGIIGIPSEPFKIYIETPSSQDLQLTPNPDDGDFSFFPSPAVIRAGQLSTSVYWRCNHWKNKLVSVAWDVTGGESSLYTETLSSTSTRAYSVGLRTIGVTPISGLVALGNSWQGSLVVYTPYLTNSSVSVTPQAADTTFEPATITLSGTQVGSFSFRTTTYGTKNIHFFLGGEGAGDVPYYGQIPDVSITVPRETIQVQIPQSIVQTNTTVLSIVLPRPPINDLTVSFYASNVQFNQSSVTFKGINSGGNDSAAVIGLTPTAQGPDTISFKITGSDADAGYYNDISDVSFFVGSGSFTGADSWYIPPLYVGVESEKLPIRASFSPLNSVTLTPTAPDLLFNPPSLTFTNGGEQKWFTITPKYTANAGSYSTTTVYWAISGPDASWFVAPDYFSVTISKRSVQIAWSAHLYNNARHLHKEYKVWATANYVGAKDAFSVTPSSPYFSFSPSTFYFNSKNTRVEFTAKVIGVVGSTTIDYLLGGQDGGWYDIVGSDSLTTAIRPLTIAQANLAPDTRVVGELVHNPTSTQLATYHVYDILLKSYVLPDSELTITPHCNHAEFSPKSITFKPGDGVSEVDRGDYSLYDNVDTYYYFGLPGLFLEANFTVKPLAAGTHEVWFELTDDDAPYYVAPQHTYFTFNTVTRPSYEPDQKDFSGASAFGPSVIVVAFTVIAAMFL